jgi:hypothetical protein
LNSIGVDLDISFKRDVILSTSSSINYKYLLISKHRVLEAT